MSVTAVFIGTALIPYVVASVPATRADSVRDDRPDPPSPAWAFLHSSLHVTARTVPLILLGSGSLPSLLPSPCRWRCPPSSKSR